MKKNILFICRHNMFRSKVAEYCLKQIYTKNRVKSAGLIKANKPLLDNQIKVFSDLDINVSDKFTPISIEGLEWADRIIIVTDDIPIEIFSQYNVLNKLERWDITDVKTGTIKEIEGIISNIKDKVLALEKELNYIL